ncbi:MAG: pyruvate synthase subunit PorB [Dehalococcoidales bacterium]|jgi:pyruvate ferredoxin oxidoreductase beta subunit|nr:pyruvate synthase subunit PorB [Dehalococcoidales bacterium]MDD4230140.1 pyruvate synthase subunit PorB [Dehalococcoidales bacterium]MDD4465279.1 pyruvate synthase subunit PorB [Dehalococcoidales bacterium]
MMIGQSVYVPRLLPELESLAPGHRACIGCGEVLAMRQAFKAIGRDAIVVNATGCMEIIASQLPYTSWRLPWIHTLFENTAAVASGVEAGLKAMYRKGRYSRPDTKIVAVAGDGGTVDIGLQALSGALERGHNLLYICFDNEGYMNTGIQRSSATPYGASTTTSPAGKESIGQFSWKKDLPGIAVAHRIPYVATACPSYPVDLIEKVKKGVDTRGPAYIHIFSGCPTGWGCATNLTVRLGRLAVETGIFPLYEVENGKYTMSYKPEKLRPITDYMKPQRRFRHLTDDAVEMIEKRVAVEYYKLLEKAECQK